MAMGTKRVGLARVEKLIENLKRELSLNGTQFVGMKRGVKHITTSSGGSDTLTAADSGKIIFVDGTVSGNHTVSLPSPAGNDGLEYIIILKADNHSGTKVLVDSTLTSGIKGLLKVLATDMEDGASVLNHAHRILGFGTSSKLGSTIHLVSDGNFYHVVEAVSSNAFVTS
tara:strand:- start:73 stop:582 length:510 start_codon:yes stop_codon:yes gene_type:complete